ncbi:MAG TPA: galactose-1-epimerase, partial [Luteolibacter sp.]|nr:galactose-1-epimerase [Luteolibacter sp.]
MSCALYGQLPDGRPVHCYTLRNRHGITARVMDYGAILIGLEAPDATGRCADLTHGFDDLDGWLSRNAPFFGATVGRYGNRIAKGRFTLDGQAYELATNNAPAGIPCALHGGLRGFDKRLWQSRILNDGRVEMSLDSPAGEEGYPGTLRVTLIWSLNDDNELIWQASATTDAPTVINLIHHSYWNLSGDGSRDILDHRLTLHA